MTPATRPSASFGRWSRPAIYAGLLAYFLFFSWDRRHYHFAADDMMNMGTYFSLGPWRALAAQFLPWEGFYRPMGAAFYLPLQHWFGLRPGPFHIAVMLLLVLNAFLLFRLAGALGCGDLGSGLAALVVVYHAGLGNLEYNVDMVYDVLCFSFFAGTLLYYIRIRGQKRPWRWNEIAVLLGLYLCALNSKEMAFTFPLLFLAYEWFYHRPPWGRAWMRGPGLVIGLMAALALADLYGKIAAPGAMMSNPSYRPVFSWERLAGFQLDSWSNLLGFLSPLSGEWIIAIWVLITYLAWRRSRPVLRFCWAAMQ